MNYMMQEDDNENSLWKVGQNEHIPFQTENYIEDTQALNPQKSRVNKLK